MAFLANWPSEKTSNQRENSTGRECTRKLVAALRAEGHEVESIHTLRLQGLENGKLCEFARDSFDLCFTRDAGFANNVRQGAPPSRLKLLRVTLQ